MPVTLILRALITTTWSPVSMNGVYCGLSLPARTRATRAARRPRVCPEASTTYHLRAISPALGKWVDITISLTTKNKTNQLKDLSEKHAYSDPVERRIQRGRSRVTGGQPQDTTRFKNSRGKGGVSISLATPPNPE